MKKLLLFCLALSTSMVGADAFANDRYHGGYGYRGYGHHYGHGRHYGHGSHIGVLFSVPLILRPYDYYSAYPHTRVVVERQPQIYVQREAPAVQPAPSGYWYYCPDSRTYYPYAQTCP
ncbi:MAG: hypothetical protein HYY36_03995, partial [Gammaproteobacteria bacterium]|nr:hypothetical protein [Gammaproteobacteria bacterium]